LNEILGFKNGFVYTLHQVIPENISPFALVKIGFKTQIPKQILLNTFKFQASACLEGGTGFQVPLSFQG
jgi:hypothetical protein